MIRTQSRFKQNTSILTSAKFQVSPEDMDGSRRSSRRPHTRSTAPQGDASSNADAPFEGQISYSPSMPKLILIGEETDGSEVEAQVTVTGRPRRSLFQDSEDIAQVPMTQPDIGAGNDQLVSGSVQTDREKIAIVEVHRESEQELIDGTAELTKDERQLAEGTKEAIGSSSTGDDSRARAKGIDRPYRPPQPIAETVSRASANTGDRYGPAPDSGLGRVDFEAQDPRMLRFGARPRNVNRYGPPTPVSGSRSASRNPLPTVGSVGNVRNADMLGPRLASVEDLQNIVGDALRTVADSVTNLTRALAATVPSQSLAGQSRASSGTVGTQRSNRSSGSRCTDSSDEDLEAGSVSSSRTYNRSLTNPKLPPFTGKEKWEVWFTRFTEVASLNNWSERRRLQELLPRLQGPSGDFVYGQLPSEIRSNYVRLVRELNSRFRVVETKKTFGAQFSNRNQKPGESAEEFAAELKRLYTKAYPSRNEATRNEDLLRRFLDGLYDERARFHVEFVKEPDSIDRAVYELINFQETRRRPVVKEGHKSRPTRAVRSNNDSEVECEDSLVQPSEDDDDSSEERIGRVPSNAGKHKRFTKPEKQDQASSCKPKANPGTDQLGTVTELLAKLTKQIDNLGRQGSESNKVRSVVNDNAGAEPKKRAQKGCFKCGSMDHFARRCPNFKWVQVPVQEPSTPVSGTTANPEVSAAPVHQNSGVTNCVKLDGAGTVGQESAQPLPTIGFECVNNVIPSDQLLDKSSRPEVNGPVHSVVKDKFASPAETVLAQDMTETRETQEPEAELVIGCSVVASEVEGETIRRNIPRCPGVYLEGSVQGTALWVTADTGASRTVLAKSVYDRIPESRRPKLKSANVILDQAGGSRLTDYGSISVRLKLGAHTFSREVCVADIKDEMLLGMDVGNTYDVVTSKGIVIVDGFEIPCIHVKSDRVRKVRAPTDLVVPGGSESIFDVKVEAFDGEDDGDLGELLVEPTPYFSERHPLVMAATLVDVKRDMIAKIRIMNPFDQPVMLHKKHGPWLCPALRFRGLSF